MSSNSLKPFIKFMAIVLGGLFLIMFIYELNTAMKLTKEGMNAGEAIDMAVEMRANAECIEAE